MNSTVLMEVVGAMVVLLLVASGVMISVLRAHKRQQLFASRIDLAVRPVERQPDPMDEQVSLTKTVSRMDQLKDQAAALISVDLQQAETYPIKWWLVPPLSLLVGIGVVELAAHPLGHRYLLYIFGLPFIWLILTKFIFNWFTNRRNGMLLEQFPDALSTVVRCVRVGIPMGEALRTVSRDALEPTKTEFGILADKVSIGIALDVALRELSVRIKLTEYQFFATALTLQARSGGGITQTLETLAEVIRKRVGLKARGYALTAEARTSAMILSVLPFVAGGAIFVMQRDYIILLFDTKSGQACLATAILLMGMGMGIIRYMIINVLK
jgi:tight adherence protein B